MTALSLSKSLIHLSVSDSSDRTDFNLHLQHKNILSYTVSGKVKISGRNLLVN